MLGGFIYFVFMIARYTILSLLSCTALSGLFAQGSTLLVYDQVTEISELHHLEAQWRLAAAWD